MTEPATTIKHIDWKNIFPWLIIFRTLPIAVSPSIWILALAGVILTPMGWLIGETLFVGESLRLQDSGFNRFVEQSRSPFRGVLDASTESLGDGRSLADPLSSGPGLVFQRLSDPVRRIFDTPLGFLKFGYLLLGGLWTIGIWSFCGCGIARICLLRLTQDDSAGLDDALQFSVSRFSTCVAAIVLPLLGVAVACVPCFAIGLLLTSDIGTMLGGLLWFFVLAIAAVMAVVLIALLFGWPLIICAISAENQNALDAITRAFAYILQRPLHAAFYSAVSILFGGICWLLVAQVTVTTVQLGSWSASWGSNVADASRMDQIRSPVSATGESASGGMSADSSASTQDNQSTALSIGKRIIHFWNGLLFTVAVAFLYGQFWCLASAVYLLLRKDVDETEMDEVYQTEQTRSYDLPPLKSDANGIPNIEPLDENSRSKPGRMNEADT